MVKVISYCLWGKNSKYCVGAIRNADLARQIYPGWISRFYCAESVPEDTIIGILQHGQGWKSDDVYRSIWRSHDDLTEIHFVKGEGNWNTMLDRFLPILDPNVEVILSRDTDSRLSQREKDCVDEFLESDKKFHIIRDHPWHTTEILGGLWGAKQGFITNFKQLIDEWPKEDHYQIDQEFLREKIWPLVRYNSLIHDGIFEWGTGIPTPSLRKGLEFLGETFNENDEPNQEHKQILYKYLKSHGETSRNDYKI